MKTFRDLKFKKIKFGSICAKVEFDNGFVMSVVAGQMAYSTPREDKDSVDDFVSFEVAVMDGSGEFVTKDFTPDDNGDVLGWQDRGEINTLMLLIQNAEV